VVVREEDARERSKPMGSDLPMKIRVFLGDCDSGNEVTWLFNAVNIAAKA